MNLITLARNLNRIEAYLNKQEAVLSAQVPEWFKKMTRDEQKQYLKEHPGSKMKVGQYKQEKKAAKKPASTKKASFKKPQVYSPSKEEMTKAKNDLQKLAQRYLKNARREIYPDMKEMYENDAKNLGKLWNLLKTGQAKKAGLFYEEHLDSSPRDDIPRSVTKLIYKKYESFEKELERLDNKIYFIESDINKAEFDDNIEKVKQLKAEKEHLEEEYAKLRKKFKEFKKK